MNVQPDPCPFKGSLCREIEVQTRTRDTLQWTRRCLQCARQVIMTAYTPGEIRDVEAAIKGETYEQAAARWKLNEAPTPGGSKELENTDRGARETLTDAQRRWRANEVTGYKSNRRQRHAAKKRKQ